MTTQTTIQCPKCKEWVPVCYCTSLGHLLADEALAINRAIQTHQCSVRNLEAETAQ